MRCNLRLSCIWSLPADCSAWLRHWNHIRESGKQQIIARRSGQSPARFGVLPGFGCVVLANECYQSINRISDLLQELVGSTDQKIKSKRMAKSRFTQKTPAIIGCFRKKYFSKHLFTKEMQLHDRHDEPDRWCAMWTPSLTKKAATRFLYPRSPEIATSPLVVTRGTVYPVHVRRATLPAILNGVCQPVSRHFARRWTHLPIDPDSRWKLLPEQPLFPGLLWGVADGFPKAVCSPGMACGWFLSQRFRNVARPNRCIL